MEGLFSEEDIQRILAENDPIQGLSKSELEMLRDIIIARQKVADGDEMKSLDSRLKDIEDRINKI